jgi:hypothetical protein
MLDGIPIESCRYVLVISATGNIFGPKSRDEPQERQKEQREHEQESRSSTKKTHAKLATMKRKPSRPSGKPSTANDTPETGWLEGQVGRSVVVGLIVFARVLVVG